MNIQSKSGEEIEKAIHEEAEKIIDSLKGNNYKVINKILETARIILERKAIVG